MASRPRQRLPLGRKRGRLGYERRLHLALWLLGAPLFALAALLLRLYNATGIVTVAMLALTVVAWAVLQSLLAEQFLRPLHTLTNVVAALREQDYSFRARGGRRGDALGDLALEVNALASDLQAERHASLESAALVRRVLHAMDAPVLAFDRVGMLRLLNPAAMQLLHLRTPQQALGKHAIKLGIEHLLAVDDEQVTTVGGSHNATQWMVRRSQFREHGIPHSLLLLSDVSIALRLEEQQAWRRLIRVLGHEINNSLTPIKSLAGTMLGMARAGEDVAEFERPLAIIEERADSLNRFLTAYRQLAQLPPPQLQPVALQQLLPRLASLETRLAVEVCPGPELTVLADPDQLAQAVINLMRNATDAVADTFDLLRAQALPQHALVQIAWHNDDDAAAIEIRDAGPGIANPSNLFVPFYTTKPQGTGIGLALVKQIAEAHGGSITLANQQGGGVLATLRLPLQANSG